MQLPRPVSKPVLTSLSRFPEPFRLSVQLYLIRSAGVWSVSKEQPQPTHSMSALSSTPDHFKIALVRFDVPLQILAC